MSEESFLCPLFEHSQKYSNHPFLISEQKTLSYGEANEIVEERLKEVSQKGVQSGSRVGVLVQNKIEDVLLLFVLWRLKAVPVLMNPKWPETLVNQCLEDLDCLVQKRTTKLSPSVCDYRFKDPATIIFTSGSSSDPKAVLHSFENHYYSAKGSNENISFKKNDRWLLSLPLYHVAGLSLIFRTTLAGGSLVLDDSKNVSDAIQKFDVTHVSMVPTQLYRVFKNDDVEKLKSLKCILLGGSAIPENLISQAIEKKLPMYVSYGSTEMSSQIATSGCIREMKDRKQVKVLNHRQLKIADDGQILVKGKTLFQGYVAGDLIHRPLDNEEWFHTGDLGVLDENGSLSVLGRKDNMFISGGENIQPEEIEKYLCQHPDIQQAMVVPLIDEEFGERPVAFIQFMAEAKVSRQDLEKYLLNYLPKFKLPVKFIEWTPDPKQEQPLKWKRSYFQQMMESYQSKAQE